MAGAKYTVDIDGNVIQQSSKFADSLRNLSSAAGTMSDKISGAGQSADAVNAAIAAADSSTSGAFRAVNTRVESLAAGFASAAPKVRALGEQVSAVGDDIAAKPIAALLKFDAAVGRTVDSVSRRFDSASKAVSSVGRTVRSAFDGLASPVRRIMGQVSGRVSDAVSKARRSLDTLADSARSRMRMFTRAVDSSTQNIQRTMKRVGSVFGDAGKRVGDFARDMKARLATAFSGATSAVGKLRGAFTSGMRALTGWRRGVGDADKATQSFGSSAMSTMSVFKGALLANAVAKVGELAVNALRAAGHFMAFGERAEFAFGILSQGKFGGDRAMKLASATAQRLGTDLQETTAMYQGLLSAGVDIGRADDLVLLAADFKAAGNEIAGSAIARSIQEIQSKAGQFTGTEMMGLIDQLKAVDISRQAIQDSLSKVKGTDIELEADIKAGNISADDLQQAIIEASNSALGQAKPGEQAKKFADKTFSGAAGRMKALFEGSLAEVGTRVLSPLADRLKPLIDRLQTWFESDEGKQFFDTIGRVANKAVDILSELGSIFGESFGASFGEVKKALAPVFDMFTGEGDTMLMVLRSTARVLGTLAGVAVGAAAVFGMLAGAVAAVAVTISTVFYDTVIGSVKALGEWLGEAVFGVINWFADLSAKFDAGGDTLWEKMKSIGGFVVDGLVQGIKAVAMAPINAITSIGENLAGSFKSVLGISSPSKVMFGLGVNTGEGVALGVESQESAVTAKGARLGKSVTAGFDKGLDAMTAEPMFKAPSLAASAGSFTLPKFDASMPSITGETPVRTPERPVESASPMAPLASASSGGSSSGGARVNVTISQTINGSDGVSAEQIAQISAREARREIENLFEQLELDA